MKAVPHPAVTPDEARRLAESFASYVISESEAFTPASLVHADDCVSGYHRMACMGILDQQREAGAIDVAQRTGCYLGEVIVRNLGGRWRPTAETGWARLPEMAAYPLVVELPNGHQCNPLARPFKLLERGREGESMLGFYQGLESLAREPAQPSPPPPRRPWWRFWG
jgi:hypothetical protein